MAQRYKAYFTVPTGRQSPPSAANSSASDTSVLSTKQQQPSSYVSIQHPRGRVNPFKFSLNFVVNVQPMDNNEQHAAQSDSRSSHDSSKTPTNRRYKNKQSLLSFASLNKSRNSSLGTSLNDTLRPRRLSFNESENEEVFGGESTDSRSSQASLINKRKIQTTGNRYKNKKSLLRFASKPRSKSTGTALPGFQHYPRPRPLSFNESGRSDDVPEYETMRSDADKTFPLDKTFRNSLGFDGNLCPRADVEINEVGVVEVKSSFSHTSQDSLNDKNGADTATNKEVGAIRSKSYNSDFPQDPSNLAFSSFKKPRSKSVGRSATSTPIPLKSNSIGTSVTSALVPLRKQIEDGRGSAKERERKSQVACNRPRRSDGTFAPLSGFTTQPNRSSRPSFQQQSDHVQPGFGVNDSVAYVDSHFLQNPSNLAFSSSKKPQSKCIGASATSTPVPLDSKAPVYHHQRQVRIGFIMNGVQTAVNVMVNIRSNDEFLYVRPVELLYEGEEIWRGPVRQIVQAMEEFVDKKNQIK
uniref:Uncharacterized protein n=1 Tax=Panagrolaimus sp. PS1159 TaxID=55785 RepID=A0AC35GSF9_9BILA